ncbi:hypothetical protein PCYB_113950 [Plasmodium cynomolgi strain B]|uniref:Uncharacterized protein n=1 Tax=Plasmodium cynomolgi (strain B) TaxID=1120755 RepID=K6UXX1_PLACD|nr:hypothetical protein PCYB_113950 [Plasmodium cynomolgi strain B]GAB67375.1 hypothetical protein PCYB_113950 [Plasmodium cynomolgi strain B]
METENNEKKTIEEISSSTENLVEQKSIENLTSIDNTKNEKINVEENNYSYFDYTENETFVKKKVQSIHNACTVGNERNIFCENNMKHSCMDSLHINLPDHDKDDADYYTDAEDLIKAKKSNEKSTEKYRSKYKNKFLRLFRKKAYSNNVKDQHMCMNEVASVMEGVGERRRASSTDGSSGGGHVRHNLSGSFNEYNRDLWRGDLQQGGFKQGDFKQGGFKQGHLQQGHFQQRCAAGKGVTCGTHIPIGTPTEEIHRGGENHRKEPFFQRKAQNIVAPIRESRTCSIKTDDNLIMDLQNEHMVGVDLEEHKGTTGTIDAMGTYRSGERHPQTREQKISCESIARKIYSIEKIKSFMSNNTFLKDKKYLLQKKKIIKGGEFLLPSLQRVVVLLPVHGLLRLCYGIYLLRFMEGAPNGTKVGEHQEGGTHRYRCNNH